MVLPQSSGVGCSVLSRPPSSLSDRWCAPLVSPASPRGVSGLLTTRKPTPIPPKRTFASPSNVSLLDSKDAHLTAATLSPCAVSPQSATHKLAVPTPTPNAVESPSCSPLLTVRHCLPLSASPASDVRLLPIAPPSSPAVSVLDTVARSAAFKQLMQQQATHAEEGGKDEQASVDSGVSLAFTASDEKRHSLSSSGGNRRGVDWMPVVAE